MVLAPLTPCFVGVVAKVPIWIAPRVLYGVSRDVGQRIGVAIVVERVLTDERRKRADVRNRLHGLNALAIFRI